MEHAIYDKKIKNNKNANYTLELSRVSLDTLVYFYIVCEEKNLSKAAERISISRQALSKSIASLEQTIGKQLFYRTRHGVVPTLIAQELIPHVEIILEECNHVFKQEKIKKSSRQVIRICAAESMCQIFTTEFCYNFSEKHHVAIHFSETNEQEAMDKLLNNSCDLAILSDLNEFYDLRHTYVFHTDFGIYMSKDHPLVSKKTVGLSDLSSEKVISTDLGLRYYDKYAHEFYINNEIDFAFIIANYGKRCEMVRSGKFLSLNWNYELFKDTASDFVFKNIKELPAGVNFYLVENRYNSNTKNKELYRGYLEKWINSYHKSLPSEHERNVLV